MDRKIEHIFKFEDRLLKTKKGIDCSECFFFSERKNKPLCSTGKVSKMVINICGGCMGFEREDKERVVFIDAKESNEVHYMEEMKIPSNINLKTMIGEPKTKILVDLHMIPLVTKLFEEGIVTTGSCQGYHENNSVLRNVAWVQIDIDTRIVPEWLVELAINKTMEVIDKYATFPVYLYSPRCSPIENPMIYMTRKHFSELEDRGFKFDCITYVI